MPTKLVEALNTTLSLATEEPGQKLAQNEIVRSIEAALDARRQRIIISQSTVSVIKWAGLSVAGALHPHRHFLRPQR